MSRSVERLRDWGVIVDKIDVDQVGRQLLDALEERLGPDLVAAAVGSWVGRHHRDRPRLFWSRPDAHAQAPHYLAFVRELSCAKCSAPPSSVIDPHHYGPRGMGQKTDDYRTIPLCRVCHLEAHRHRWSDAWMYWTQVSTLIQYLRMMEQT